MPKPKNQTTNNAVAHQNKDILSKCAAEHFANKSFQAYGVDLPPIISVEPTNLPEIEANELRMDNLFHLADDSYAIVDYESTYKDISKLKYMGYIIRTLKRQLRKRAKNPRLRIVVLYTADVKRGDTNPTMDVGCMKLHIEEAFLSELNSEQIEKDLRHKIENKIALSEKDQMSFIILPLTYAGKKAKQDCLRRCFELIKHIENAALQVFLLSNMLVFADKVISEEDSKEMKGWMNMTKIDRLYYEEKMEAVKQARKEAKKEAKKELDAAVAKNRNTIVKALLKNGVTIEQILNSIDSLTLEDINKLQAAV